MEHLPRAACLPAAGAATRDGKALANAVPAGPRRSSPSSKACGRAAPAACHCAQVGEALARMHVAGRGLRDHPQQRSRSRAGGRWSPARRAPTRCSAGPRRLIQAELAFLEAHWPKDLPAGVIHADLFPGQRLLPRRPLSGLIDFYFACNDILAYDLAICLNAWCFEKDGAFNITKGGAARRLPACGRFRPAEIAALPLLARGSALRFLLTRLYDWLMTPPARSW
jgi:homoserine kinase type II